MENKFDITAITDCLPDGQKTVAAAISYGKDINSAEIEHTAYSVRSRNITKVYISESTEGKEPVNTGSIVMLELDPDDAGAETVISPPKPPHGPPPPKMRVAPEVVVSQLNDITAADGEVIGAFENVKNNCTLQPIIDRFKQFEYKGLKYNLFIPEEASENNKLPLVQFIGDIGANGEDALMALSQGNGGTCWADPAFQKEHPCFVLVEQIPFKEIVTIECTCDPIVDTVEELLWHVADSYPVDKDRIYLTGQSQGCMTSCELNLRRPGSYAASLLVAGQWDSERMGKELKDENLWIVVSEEDDRAFPEMSKAVQCFEAAGAKVGKYIWDAAWSERELNEAASSAAEDDVNIRFTVFKGDSVLYDRKSGEQKYRHAHAATWPLTYSIDGLENWLLSVKK